LIRVKVVHLTPGCLRKWQAESKMQSRESLIYIKVIRLSKES